MSTLSQRPTTRATTSPVTTTAVMVPSASPPTWSAYPRLNRSPSRTIASRRSRLDTSWRPGDSRGTAPDGTKRPTASPPTMARKTGLRPVIPRPDRVALVTSATTVRAAAAATPGSRRRARRRRDGGGTTGACAAVTTHPPPRGGASPADARPLPGVRRHGGRRRARYVEPSRAANVWCRAAVGHYRGVAPAASRSGDAVRPIDARSDRVHPLPPRRVRVGDLVRRRPAAPARPGRRPAAARHLRPRGGRADDDAGVAAPSAPRRLWRWTELLPVARPGRDRAPRRGRHAAARGARGSARTSTSATCASRPRAATRPARSRRAG